METKIKTGIGLIIILILVTTIGVFVWQVQKSTDDYNSNNNQNQKALNNILAYTGGGSCPSCDLADPGWQCVSPEESSKINRERQKILRDPNGPQCSLCMPNDSLLLFRCVCDNGICIKTSQCTVDTECRFPVDAYKCINNNCIYISQNDTSDWQTYRSEEYGFEFRYPSDYSFEIIKDYKGSDWQFKLTSPGKEVLFISREDNRFPELNTFEKFALNRSEVYCDADSPHGSVYCSDDSKKSVFTNPSGIVGYEIYLNETTEDYTTNQKTTRIKGPIFALDFSQLNNPDIRGIFINREDTFPEKEIINQILSTFKFTPH